MRGLWVHTGPSLSQPLPPFIILIVINCTIPLCYFNNSSKSMQKLATEAITAQIQPSNLTWEITNSTNIQNTNRTYGQPSAQLFPKSWPLSNQNRPKNNMNTHKVKRRRNSESKTGSIEPKQNYRQGTVSNQ